MPVRQHALTIVAPVTAGAREGLSDRLEKAESAVHDALEKVTSLHFARFVVLGGPKDATLRLAFESNHDGDLDAHLAQLATALADLEDTLFGAWEGYRKGDLAGFAATHALPPSTFYLGHPGLSVAQIRNDRDVRVQLEALLDEEVTAGGTGGVDGRTARDVRARLVSRLADAGFVTGPVDRGLPLQPWAKLFFWAIVVPIVALLAIVFIPLSLLVEWHERRTEPVRELVSEDDPRLSRINAREDAIMQNGLTHHVALRPGAFRKITMRAVLWFLEQARRNIAYEGVLGGIPSIHFARWVMLEDDTVLFFSNYDGSWEAYLGDFVDKAHLYLTAVWSNTRWFPDAHGLIFGGAAKESTFKQWTRTCQVENPIWYSAYKNVTVQEVLRNEQVRHGASKDEMTEREAQAWLVRL